MIETIEKVIQFLSIINYAYPILSPIIFVLVVLFDRDRLTVKLDAVAKFISLLAIVGAVKLALWNGKPVPSNFHNMSMANFLLVFLEDVFFVMVPFYLTNFIKNKNINIAIWVFFSMIFGSGHLYQGLIAVFITGIYPYFISNHFAKKTSFGTVMVCHFLWDCFVFVLPKLNNLLF
jgi:hypothetical protein